MNIQEIISRSIDMHMWSVYKKIINDDLIGEDKTPISLESYDGVIKYYEDSEEYEICAKILRKKNLRINHEKNFYNPPSNMV